MCEYGFIVENQAVYEALFGALRCEQQTLIGCNGYLNTDRHHIGRAFLTFCFSKMFQIFRLYGFEDGFIEKERYDIREAFSKLNKEELDAAIAELNKLYAYTQAYLSQNEAVNDGKIHVVRALRNYEIDQIAWQYYDNSIETLTLFTNTITSYAKDTRYGDYHSCVSISRDVPIEDVLVYYKALSYPDECCSQYRLHGGEHEVIVKNDHPMGILKLDRSQIHVVNEELFRIREKNKPRHTFNPLAKDDACLKIHEDFSRPCEADNLVRLTMKIKGYL